MIQQEVNKWVIRTAPNPDATLRLFCFPYSGGGASVFRSWSEYLPPQVEVCAIELPGRESRFGESLFSELPPLTQALAPALEPFLSTDIPFVFFGHCMGALIGFDLALHLRKQYHLHPLHLFASGYSAPQRLHIPSPLHKLPDAEFTAEIRRMRGTPQQVLQNASMMQLMLPILRADFAISETYSYQENEPLSCPISGFGGLQDKISREDLLGWEEQTSNAFSLRMFPGDHFFIHRSRLAILNTLSQELSYLLSSFV